MNGRDEVEDLFWWKTRSMSLKVYPTEKECKRIANANRDLILKRRDAMRAAVSHYEDTLRDIVETEGYEEAENPFLAMLKR